MGGKSQLFSGPIALFNIIININFALFPFIFVFMKFFVDLGMRFANFQA